MHIFTERETYFSDAQSIRKMGGGATPAHWKSLKQVCIDNKNHMDFLPVPKGSWQEYWAKNNAKWNQQLALALVANVVIFSGVRIFFHFRVDILF